MAISFCVRSFFVAGIALLLSVPAQAQDPHAPPPDRPGISIGGPFGVIIGGGRGLRIGGPNGAQFGGGVGARFGGDYGAQFGGGEGVRIGPRDYGRPPANQPGAEYAAEPAPARFINPAFEPAGAGEALLHYPQSAEDRVRLRIDGEEIELYPGDTIAVPNVARTSIRIARPLGGYGWRQTLRPGVYIFQQSRRGWTVAPGEIPYDQPTEQQLRPDTEPTEDLELNSPEIEQLPAPPLPGEVEAQEASDSDGPLRRLLRRRR